MLLLLCAVPVKPAAAPADAALERPAGGGGASGLIPFRRHTLENGLTVLLGEEHSQPLVSVLVWYRVGARNERPGMTGIAHYLEHMAFRATEHIAGEDVFGRIERLGGHWHGYTRLDNTTYYETARREALDWLLFLEAERMQRCRIAPEEVEVERGSVLSELKGYENDPWSLLFDDVAAVAFREHPYRYNTVGWLSDLEAITRADLADFYRRHYVPANAILVVVGDFDPARALASVRRHFGRLPGIPPPEPLRTREPPQRGEKRLTLRLPGSAPHVLVAHHAPAATDPDFLPFLLLDAILSGGRGLNTLDAGFEIGGRTAVRRSSRLYRELVAPGLAARLSTGFLPTSHPYLYTLTAEAAPGVDGDDLEHAILDSLGRLRVEPPSQQELEAARARLVNLTRLQTDTYQEVAHLRALLEALGIGHLWERLDEHLSRIGPEAIRSAARRLLRSENRTVGRFEPLPGGAASEAEAGAGAPPPAASPAAALEEPIREEAAPPDQRAGGDPEGAFRAAAGTPSTGTSSPENAPVEVPEIRLRVIEPPAPPVVRELPSGLRLAAAENPWVPTAALVVEVDAGPIFDPARRRGVAALTASLLASGSVQRSTAETSTLIDRLGLRWRVRVGGSGIDFPDPRRVRIEIELAAGDLEAVATLLADSLRAPSFPAEEFENARRAQLNAIAGLQDDAVGAAWSGLWRVLYADSSWEHSAFPLGSKASVSRIRRSSIRRFHSLAYRPQRVRIAFAGGVPAAEALGVIERAFAGWRAERPDARREPARVIGDGLYTPAAPTGDSPSSLAPPPAVARLAHKTQVQMAYGFFTGIGPDAPDYAAFEALWYVVQHGYYSGRLGDRIIGERGLAYSVASHHAAELPRAPMFMVTGAPPEKIGKLRQLWRATLDELASEGIAQSEFEAAKMYLEGRRLHDRESNLAAAQKAVKMIRRPVDRNPERIEQVTLEEVNRLARRLLQDRRARWSLAGPVP
ncbi:MAG: pitrilysin family protein [Acidobacteriota bacterium]